MHASVRCCTCLSVRSKFHLCHFQIQLESMSGKKAICVRIARLPSDLILKTIRYPWHLRHLSSNARIVHFIVSAEKNLEAKFWQQDIHDFPRKNSNSLEKLFEHRRSIGFKSMLFILVISKTTVPVGFRFTEISTKTIKFSLSVAEDTKNQQNQIFRSPICVIRSIPKKFKPVVAFFTPMFCELLHLPSKIKKRFRFLHVFLSFASAKIYFQFLFGDEKNWHHPKYIHVKKSNTTASEKKTLKPKSWRC